MTQALNYSSKVIEQLRGPIDYPGGREVADYLIDKLTQAAKFVLPDHGELLERGRERPEMPADYLRPPFPVVALEYTSQARNLSRDDPTYSAIASSRRISLAWDWQDDLPSFVTGEFRRHPAGICVISIPYLDKYARWVANPAISHIAYDAEWMKVPVGEAPSFAQAMALAGALPSRKIISGPETTLVPLDPYVCAAGIAEYGREAAMDAWAADNQDEVAAYSDLAIALRCRNVSTELRPGPAKLNAHRIKAGKAPLFDHHVLKIDGHEGGGFGAVGEGGVRSHLRRGHIRRLGPDRLTWVNATMVHGRRPGFVDKTYAVGAVPS